MVVRFYIRKWTNLESSFKKLQHTQKSESATKRETRFLAFTVFSIYPTSLGTEKFHSNRCRRHLPSKFKIWKCSEFYNATPIMKLKIFTHLNLSKIFGSCITCVLMVYNHAGGLYRHTPKIFITIGRIRSHNHHQIHFVGGLPSLRLLVRDCYTRPLCTTYNVAQPLPLNNRCFLDYYG